jgi:hypothetical protein
MSMSSDNDGNGIAHAPLDQVPRSPQFRDALNEMATGESGLGFIYSALDLLATRFELSDAAIVIANESVGLQIFRLGQRDVSVELAVRLGATPGVYCSPDIVPADDLEVFLGACQRALSSPQTRLLALNWRAIISTALVLVDVATFVMTMANIHGSGRFFLGLVFGLAIPGWSVVGLIKLKNAALEVGLTLATSLSLIMILAQFMMTLNLWHPVLLQELLCGLCLPSLWWQAKSIFLAKGRLK